MTGLYWKSDWPVAVIHPKLRERELLRNGTRGAIFFAQGKSSGLGAARKPLGAPLTITRRIYFHS
jgi:hypothetical protein